MAKDLWTLPVISAKGECIDVPHPLGAYEMQSLDRMMFGDYSAIWTEYFGPCGRTGKVRQLFNKCSSGYGNCTKPPSPMLSHALAWWGTC